MVLCAACAVTVTVGPASTADAAPTPKASTVTHDLDMLDLASGLLNFGLMTKKNKQGTLEAAIDEARTVWAETQANASNKDVKAARDELRAELEKAEDALVSLHTASCEKGDVGRGLESALRVSVHEKQFEKYVLPLEKCLRFKLTVDSEISYPSIHYTVHVQAQVPLKFELATMNFIGEGPVTKVTQNFAPGTFPKCTIVKIGFTPSNFTVESLHLDRLKYDVLDVTLSKYFPGALTGDSVTVRCPDSNGRLHSVTHPVPTWGGSHLNIHYFNSNFAFSGWTRGSAPFAIRRFDQSGFHGEKETSRFILTRLK